MSFCLYVAARIYIHTYKKQPGDMQTRSDLEFLLNAMQAQRKKNPLSESFLVQLMVDLDGCGIENPLNNLRFSFGLKKAVVSSPFTASSLLQLTAVQSEIYDEGQNCPAVLPTIPHTQPSYHSLRSSSLKPGQIPAGESPDSGLDVPSSRYRMTSFTVPTREHRSPLQDYRQINGMPTQLQGVGPGQGWGERFAVGPGGNMNNMQCNNNFDTEMSDHTSDRHPSISNIPTPTTSQHGSSNTSYSPQTNDDMDPSHQTPVSTNPGPTTSFYNSSSHFAAFTPAAEEGFIQADNHIITESEPYVMHPGWELGQDPDLPNSGLSPLGEGWRHMLDGIGWDGNTVGADPSWRSQQTSAHRS